jgi:hypothetical protein
MKTLLLLLPLLLLLLLLTLIFLGGPLCDLEMCISGPFAWTWGALDGAQVGRPARQVIRQGWSRRRGCGTDRCSALGIFQGDGEGPHCARQGGSQRVSLEERCVMLSTQGLHCEGS